MEGQANVLVNPESSKANSSFIDPEGACRTEHAPLPDQKDSQQVEDTHSLSGESGVVGQNASTTPTDEPIDGQSVKGIFGWETVDGVSVPCLLRGEKKFVSVRIVERKLLSKYPNTLPDELGEKDPLVSHFITEAEAKLLNEINTIHCLNEYGHNPFTPTDLIVDLKEFQEFFKLVKKTFPADVLAKIGEETPSSAMSQPAKTDLSQHCGWIQINNTVSPYIIRSNPFMQVKLVPLSVIVHAAGLLTNADIEGLLPTPEECSMLNMACKAAGFEFPFGKSTRLIAISEVIQRCQVQLTELPFKNPLQHARYIDPLTGLPSSNSMSGSGFASYPYCREELKHQPQSQPQPLTKMIKVRAPDVKDASLNGQNKLDASLNGQNRLSYPPGCAQSLPIGAPTTSLANYFNGMTRFQELPSSAFRHGQRSAGGPGNETPLALYQQSHLLSGRNSDSYGSGVPGSPWPAKPNPTAAPSYSNNYARPVPEAPPLRQRPPQTSVYQPQSLPPNPLLHSIMPATSPDMTYSTLNNQKSIQRPVNLLAMKESGAGVTKYNAQAASFPPYSSPQSVSLEVNPFDNPQFLRNISRETKSVGETTLVPQPVSRRHLEGVESERRPVSHSSVNSTTRTLHTNMAATISPWFGITPNVVTTMTSQNHRHRNPDQPAPAHQITACLINGKSISCLNVDSPQRRGLYCLVEAVSKLYFPCVPLDEFLKVLQVILKVNIHECTFQEEACFVQYYNLPVKRLKCNQMIRVEDLHAYFPQLSYMFSKWSSDSQDQTAAALTVDTYLAPPLHQGGQKRKAELTQLDPPLKTWHPKMENVVQMFLNGKEDSPGTAPSLSRPAPVIVIDDE